MSIIPLHLQRKFEQRWAARFVAPAAPNNSRLKVALDTLPRPVSAEEQPAGSNRRATCESNVEFGNEANPWTECRPAAFWKRHLGERQR